MVAMTYEWPAGKWLFQGLMASVLSGVGFVFLTLVFEYGKRYRRKRREREQQVILEKLLRGDVVLEWQNPKAVVPVNQGCVLRDLSGHRRSFLINNYKQHGGFLGVGRGYYARRNKPEDETNSESEHTDSRMPFTKSSCLLHESSQLGRNGNQTQDPAERNTRNCKTSLPENKNEARIFQSLINSQSTISINNVHRKDSGEPVQKDASQAQVCKQMCEEMCYRIVKEHPFIAPFIRRDILQELHRNVAADPKASTSGSTSSVTDVTYKWAKMRKSLCLPPDDETATKVRTTPKMKKRARSMSRSAQSKMRNTPDKWDSVTQKPVMSGVSKKVDMALSKRTPEIKPEFQTPNNITSTAPKTKLLKNAKSRRSFSVCRKTPLNDLAPLAQMSNLSQDANVIPEEPVAKINEDKFADYAEKGSSVDPMRVTPTKTTEHFKHTHICNQPPNQSEERKLSETPERENSVCTRKQSAQCLSGTGNKSGKEGRINEIVSVLTSWGYSIRNRVQGKDTGPTIPAQDSSANRDTRPGCSKLRVNEDEDTAKLNSKALIDLIKNLAESRKNRKLLRQISSVLSTNKTPGRTSRNSKSFSHSRTSPLLAAAETPVIVQVPGNIQDCKDKKNSAQDCTDKKSSAQDCTDKRNSTQDCTDKRNSTQDCTDKRNSIQDCKEKKNNNSASSDPATKVPQGTKICPVVKRRRIVRERSYFAKLPSPDKKESDKENFFYQASALPSMQSRKFSPPKTENEMKEKLRRNTTPQKRHRKSPKNNSLKKFDVRKMEPRIVKKTISTRRLDIQLHRQIQTEEEDDLEVDEATPCRKYSSEGHENSLRRQLESQSNSEMKNKRSIEVENTNQLANINHVEKAVQVEEGKPISENAEESAESYNSGVVCYHNNETEKGIQTADLRITNEVVSCQFAQSVVKDNHQFSQFVIKDNLFSQSVVKDNQFSQSVIKDNQVSQFVVKENQLSQSVFKDGAEGAGNYNAGAQATNEDPVKKEYTFLKTIDFPLPSVKEAEMPAPDTCTKDGRGENQKEQLKTIITKAKSKHSTSNKVRKSQTSGDFFSEIHTLKPTDRKTYVTSSKSAGAVRSNNLSKLPTLGNKSSNRKLPNKVQKTERQPVSVSTKPKEQTRTLVKRGQKNNIESAQSVTKRAGENSRAAGKGNKQTSNEIRSRYEQYQKNKLQKNPPIRNRKLPVTKEVPVELNHNINQGSLQHYEPGPETYQISDTVGQVHTNYISSLLPSAFITRANCPIESQAPEIGFSIFEEESRQTDYHQMLGAYISFENDQFETHSDGEDAVAWATQKQGNIGQQSFNILKKSKLDVVVSSMMNAKSIFRTTDT